VKCPLCSAEMLIDEWAGWTWACFNCDHIGRKATPKEIEKHEKD